MKFLVCQKMHGDGCKYTIGCGMRFDYIEADSIEDVIERVTWPEGREEYCTLVGEDALSDILIVPAEHVVTVDVGALLAEFQSADRERQEKESEAAERAELARLQSKYPQ